MTAEGMDSEDFEGMIAGLRDVANWKKGKRDGFVAHVPSTVDVRAIRAAHNQTQEGFARTYGFSIASVRDWEQGRRQPERAARILLAMIAKEPQTVKRVMEGL
ncbi:helix-turn-helix domain-containing protein [Sphingobium boeckii]|uniref:Putative transcriptional regulator n=1 Tax=Sphingobium boeckii TaxID=1082345 RepID=A0A7W9AFJ5_9SPHN|nr:transcriptional regulator [Sphingobium boeckii]MBB5684690.1 putative transcriptional regulator [Sphingobium boeckii]